MSENNQKSIGYENYRVQSKRPRKITKEWWDRAVLAATTSDDVAKELNRLRKDDYKAWLELILKSVPKEAIVKQDKTVHVTLSIEGMQRTRMIECEEVKALPGLDESDIE
jgi:hypothetical protein